MTDRELLEMIASQVGVLTTEVGTIRTQVSTLTTQMNSLTTQVESLRDEVHDIKKTVITIEQEHGKKLSALFDGHRQNAEKLDRIEAEVVKHDEFILKRVVR